METGNFSEEMCHVSTTKVFAKCPELMTYCQRPPMSSQLVERRKY